MSDLRDARWTLAFFLAAACGFTWGAFGWRAMIALLLWATVISYAVRCRLLDTPTRGGSR